MHGYNWNWGMGMGMGVWWVLGLVLIIAIVWFMIKASSSGRMTSQNKSALDTLNERYARGEIDKDEYLEMKKRIS